MNKRIIFNTLAIAVSIIMMLSCRRKVEDRPFFPAAEYFNPTQVAPGAQLQIHGAVLDGSKVKIDGKVVEVDSIAASGNIIYVKVPNDLSIGSSYTVEVVYNERESFAFTPKLQVAAETSDIKELLIGDFDGGGIRSAIATTDFTNGQWSGNAGANSSIGIGTNINGVSESPAGGNYAFGTVYGGGILPNTNGFVATISSRSGLRNDLVSDWPENFFEYPGSILDIDEDTIKNYYINFLVNYNNNPDSRLRVFVGNAKLNKEQRYAETIRPITTTSVNRRIFVEPVGDKGWYRVSISLDNFQTGYGFTAGGMSFEDFKGLNQIDFDITDRFDNSYDTDCCVGSITTCCATAIKAPVQVYIDQVVISHGGIAPSVQ